jgi:glutamyl/glutaminyl-tRNA synthetase
MTPAALWLQLNEDEAARSQSARRQVLRAADLNMNERESDLIASDLAYAQLRSSGEMERARERRALQEQVQREGTSS